jgi:hypothetical protein
MSGITIEQHVAAPPAEVFAKAADFARAPEFIRAIKKMEMLTEGPVGVGTRFRETRIVFKREAAEVMEVAEFDPPRRYVLRCENHGCRYRTEFAFTPNGTGTNVRMTFEAVPLTRLTKVLSFLMKPMIKACAKECAKDLEDIKAAVEARAAPGSGTS